MCKVPLNESSDFFNLIKLVELRLESHNQILTANKVLVLEVLFEKKEHLSVEDIIVSTYKKEKKLTATTVYRVLSAFETLGIVDFLMVDNKKLYELVYTKQPHYHLYCMKCQTITEFDNLEIHKMFLKELELREFTPTGFNVIINGVCKSCQKKIDKK